MTLIAIKMLVGSKAACLGIIFGSFLAILIISQQSAIFLGLVSRSYRIVTDIPAPNLWVIDPTTQGEDLIRSMPRDHLAYIKNMPEIEWAVPVNYRELPLTTYSGIYRVAQIY